MGRTMITIDYPTTEAGMAKAAIAEATARGDHDWAAMLTAKLSKFVGAPREAHATMFEVDDNKGRDTSNAPRRQVQMANDKQLGFIRSLLERFLNEFKGRVEASGEFVTWVQARLEANSLTAAQASIVLVNLKTALGMDVNPRFIPQQHERSAAGVPNIELTMGGHVLDMVDAPATPAAPTKAPLNRDALKAIPDGYYALRREDSTEIDFLRIKHKKDGFISVKRVLGGGLESPRLEPMRWAQALAFATKIAEVGIDISHKLYADEMRRCFLCNLELTDDESRARGMGSTCASK